MALLLRRWRPPVSAPMMDSARMPHSFLLDQYVNPLRGLASSRWETILIYESISEASGQTGHRGVRLDLRQPTSEQQWDVILLQANGILKNRNQVRTSTQEPWTLHSSRQGARTTRDPTIRYYFNIKVTMRYYYKTAICSVLQYSSSKFLNFFFKFGKGCAFAQLTLNTI